MSSHNPVLVLVPLLLALVPTVFGYASYQTNIPNGNNVPGHAAVGHTSASGGGARNSFGSAFAAASNSWTTALCNADSDGDGQSNGFELGDPDCTWTSGQTPSRTTDISNPGDSSSVSAATAATPSPPTTTATPSTTTTTAAPPGATPAPPTPQPTAAPTQVPVTNTPSTPQPSVPATPIPAVAALPAKVTSAPVTLLGGVLSVNWTVVQGSSSGRRRHGGGPSVEAGDFVDVQLNVEGDQYAGIGFSPSGMEGPFVAAYLSASGVAFCRDFYSTAGYAVSLRAGTTQVVRASLSGSTRSITCRVNATEVGLHTSGGDARAIFAHGAWSSAVNWPTQHAGTARVGRRLNFAAGTAAEEKGHFYGPMSLIISVVVILLMTVIGGILNAMGFVPRPAIRTLLWVLTFVVVLALIVFVTVMAHEDYVQIGSVSPVGRAFGDTTAFLFFLVLWPTTKHIGPAHLMGISYEKFLITHMSVGCLIVLFMTTHFAVLFGHYATKSSQAQARSFVFSWDTTTPRINLAGFLSWVFLMIIVLPAVLLRRKFFSFFRAIHFLFLLVLIFGAIHHWQLWILIAPSFLVWVVDMVLRLLSKGKVSPKIVKAAFHADAGVSEVVVDVKQLDLQAAQYAFLGFSGVGMTLLHPFSIASCRDNTVKFFIKDMGDGTFTHKVAEVAAKGGEALGDLQWMGPYGRVQVPLENMHNVLLVSGGIGVTPMVSTLQYIANMQKAGSSAVGGLKHVRFVWIVRSGALVDIIGPEIEAAAADITGAEVSIQVFVTKGPLASGAFNHLKQFNGRPKLDDVFGSVPHADGGENANAAYVCGPEPLMDEVSTLAGKYEMYLHSETFEF